jgi:hypothetical protein
MQHTTAELPCKTRRNEWFDRLKKGIENRGDRAITERGMSKQGGNRGLSYNRRRQGPSGRKNKVCRKTVIEISKDLVYYIVIHSDTPASTRYLGDTPQPRRSSTRFLV